MSGMVYSSCCRSMSGDSDNSEPAKARRSMFGQTDSRYYCGSMFGRTNSRSCRSMFGQTNSSCCRRSMCCYSDNSDSGPGSIFG